MNTIWLDLLGAEVRYRGRKFKTRTIEMGGQNPKSCFSSTASAATPKPTRATCSGWARHYHAIAIDLVWHGLSSKPPFTADMVPMYSRQVLDHLRRSRRRERLDRRRIAGRLGRDVDGACTIPNRVDKIILNTAAGINWNRDKVKIDEASGTNLLRERSLAAICNPDAARRSANGSSG